VSIEVRPQAKGDEARVRTLLSEAFDDTGHVADLAEALRARKDKQASLVALDDGLLVGHTHLSICWVDAPTRLVEVLTLSPLAVTPSHQSRGIGKRLLNEAICTAVALGSPLLFVEGDPAYYSRHGWLAATDLGFIAPSTRIPLAAFQVVALQTYDSVVMRGALIYNDTFWSHDSVGLRL
jgi:putative acetyltransferase